MLFKFTKITSMASNDQMDQLENANISIRIFFERVKPFSRANRDSLVLIVRAKRGPTMRL